MLHLHLTRDSVAAGDDCDAPHSTHVIVPDCSTALEIVEEILRRKYLPSISGGRATWVVTSGAPFAVCAQEWAAPQAIGLQNVVRSLVRDDDKVRLHFSYLAQFDPDVVREVLSRC
ncbi:MAG TPA: hypothetical protein P5572_19920, partial [Phycisphaerae bacterium]|nr:hypothetical protein [Phycisphaerae bacterium]